MIRIDYRASNWREKGLRCLQAGAILEAVPEDRLESLVSGAEERGIDLHVEDSPHSYRLVPVSVDEKVRGEASRG